MIPAIDAAAAAGFAAAFATISAIVRARSAVTVAYIALTNIPNFTDTSTIKAAKPMPINALNIAFAAVPAFVIS